MSKITYGAWVGLDEKAGEGNLQFQQVESKAADPDDIDVKILYCGLCGSDTSGLLGHFGPIMPPRVCGHEIVGTVVNVGPDVKNLKVGDLVGIGAQCDSCRECEWCKDHEEQHCANFTYTYGAPFSRGVAKGEICKGGFAKMWRGSARFAVPIPAGLDPAAAAPLLCGGVTVYSPLKAYGAGTTAKNVGIIGIGGLGHLGIMIAKAMGANVTAISRGTAKKDDALKLGAEKYIATTNNLTEDFKDHQRTLDLIICTINPSNLPITEYLTLLRPKGKIVLVGIVAKPLEIPTFSLIRGSKGVAASSIGSPNDLKEVLQLAADKGLQPWIQKYNFDDINRALVDFNKGLPKYRFVLANVDNGAKL